MLPETPSGDGALGANVLISRVLFRQLAEESSLYASGPGDVPPSRRIDDDQAHRTCTTQEFCTVSPSSETLWVLRPTLFTLTPRLLLGRYSLCATIPGLTAARLATGALLFGARTFLLIVKIKQLTRYVRGKILAHARRFVQVTRGSVLGLSAQACQTRALVRRAFASPFQGWCLYHSVPSLVSYRTDSFLRCCSLPQAPA